MSADDIYKNQCASSGRPCEVDTQSQQLQIRKYRPRARSISSNISPCADHETAAHPRPRPVHEDTAATPPLASPYSPEVTPGLEVVSPSVPQSYQSFQSLSPLQYSVTYSPTSTRSLELTHSDAVYIHHFSQHLAVWLDCTDASRHFTINIPNLARISPILLNAVVCFAARHMRHGVAADSAQQRCVELLIPHLSSDEVGKDDVILCAIVILRVCEQLSGKSAMNGTQVDHVTDSSTATSMGVDQARHLSGLSAMLKASQASFELNPSSPTLSHAAFWVFVRQALYNACVNQQSPNLDFNRIVSPPPSTHTSIVNVETETAWANTITWICARVVQFCFGDTASLPGGEARQQRWLELSKGIQNWQDSRPGTFEPVWYAQPDHSSENPFPEIWFTSDWHGEIWRLTARWSSSSLILVN